ncbi:ATP-binding cassette domain-containing protein [Lacticaseibacillus saniviri]|nr:ABC transporter ATP-binding protein [Lacticaseibacillus saniviri]
MESIKNTVKKRTAIQPVDSIDLFHQFERQKEQAKIVDALQIALDEVLDVSEAEYSYTIHVWKGRWTSAEQFLKAAPRKGGKLAVKDDLIKPYLAKEYKTFLSNLFSQNYRTAFTLDSGLDLSRYLANFEVELLTDAGMPASGGQQMALGLMMKLDDAKKADIVLVDEPEGSLDNVFIKKELIPKLRELSESTPVFVITHNSTLGALLNPDRLLIAKFDSNERSYQLLSGDFFAKKVRSPSGQESQSYEAFVDAMEAGIGTYKEKGIQYENLRIE